MREKAARVSSTIQGFQREHVQIAVALEQVRQLGIGSARGRESLFAARRLLLDHLERENRILYPALRRHAERDRALRRLLDDFASEMEQVAAQAAAFFEAYSADSAGLDFARDFGRLVADLGRRVHREETLLYPEYDLRGE
jgi:iron-sulfur cluster repair protein YtfE (RIC family)